jgi:hypothetical protein
MASIAYNISSFNDLVGAAALEITLQKRDEIIDSEIDAGSDFVNFLENTKGWFDNKFLNKIQEAPDHLKPVI